MCKVNIYEAKTNLSKYLQMLEEGKEEEIIITRYDKKIAKIVLCNEDKDVKRLGAGIGILPDVPYTLDDPELDAEIAKEFGY